MRRKSNNSVISILFVVIVIAAVVAYRTKQIGLGESPLSTRHSPQSESVEAPIGPRDICPDAARTPGAVNPEITQSNIYETICNSQWSTRSIRPPVSYTNGLKFEQIEEYGYSDANPRDYEEDHLIPLELAGNPTDPKNLWPEPYATSIPDGGARFKDKVEGYLHKQVCAGNLTIEEAQHEVAGDWYHVYVSSVRWEETTR